MLKIQPFERFVGDGHAFSYIGIRGDEDREGYQSKKPPVISQRPNILPVYPFKDAGMILEDIKRILTESGIGIPGVLPLAIPLRVLLLLLSAGGRVAEPQGGAPGPL